MLFFTGHFLTKNSSEEYLLQIIFFLQMIGKLAELATVELMEERHPK